MGSVACCGRDLAHDDLVGAVAVGIAEEAETAGGVGLGVAIDQQRARAEGGERRRQVDGGRGLADSALLVGDCDDASHGCAGEADSRSLERGEGGRQ